MLGAIASRAAVADTIFVSKDCLGGTCTVTGSGSVVLGRFRVTSAQQFNWEALYTGSPNRFWVSQGGINMASTQLSAAAGQANGLVSLANGLWYISINTALMGPGNYSVTGANVLGDPHITTLDGIHYDFQGAGEFVLLKEGSNFEVQSRMTPVSTASPLRPDPHTGLSSCPSLNTAAAIRTLGFVASEQQ